VDKNSEPNDQVEKFKAAARKLECDEDEAAFDERLKQIARSPKTPKEASKAD